MSYNPNTNRHNRPIIERFDWLGNHTQPQTASTATADAVKDQDRDIVKHVKKIHRDDVGKG